MKVEIKVVYKDETVKDTKGLLKSESVKTWNIDGFEINDRGGFLISNIGEVIAVYNGGDYKYIKVREVR